MSEVKFSAGGREYTVACAEGEEAHVGQLGALIDEKLQGLGGNLSSQESQNLLFGALLLADELHEAKKVASEADASLQRELGALKDAQREASLAAGQRDELKLTISRLEQELEGLQSSNQRHSGELDDIRTELTQRRDEAEKSGAEVETLTAQLADLTSERDNLAKQVENKDEILARADTHMQETKAKLAEALTAGATAAPETMEADDPDLAPALERFADLLENCADKLEGKPASA